MSHPDLKRNLRFVFQLNFNHRTSVLVYSDSIWSMLKTNDDIKQFFQRRDVSCDVFQLLSCSSRILASATKAKQPPPRVEPMRHAATVYTRAQM